MQLSQKVNPNGKKEKGSKGNNKLVQFAICLSPGIYAVVTKGKSTGGRKKKEAKEMIK